MQYRFSIAWDLIPAFYDLISSHQKSKLVWSTMVSGTKVSVSHHRSQPTIHLNTSKLLSLILLIYIL